MSAERRPLPAARLFRPVAGLGAGLLLLAGAAAAPGVASARPNAGPRGPLALSRLKVRQHKLQARITFSVRRSMPPLRRLRRYPEALGAKDRHLCLALDGRPARRRLLCPGGRVEHRRVHVGISRYYRNGRTRKLHGIKARLLRRSGRSIQLRFRLSEAELGHGRFRYFATSSWKGPECAPAESGRTSEPDAKGVCRSRLPRRGSRKGRFYPVQRVGCTTGDRGVFFNGSRHHKRIALTFDDGPGPYTSRILRVLDRAHAKATFFELGSEVPGNGRLVRRILAHGHELGNHSFAHELNPSSASIGRTSSLIRAATGFEPCVFRPPYGAFSHSTFGAAAREGMSVALWDVDTRDWSLPGSGAILSRALAARSGSIVLMHDGGGNRSQTVAALPRIIRALRSRGYRLVTVTKLMGGSFKLREVR